MTMAVERESKSWTWVNERACDECGFDASATQPSDVADIVRANLGDWRRLLAGDLDRLIARPAPATWSALEYGCHVRDVYELLAYRFDRVLAEEHPRFDDWHPNDRADAGRYQAEREPARVLAQMAAQAGRVVHHVESMTPEGWQRQGTRADGVVFTAAWLSTYLTHDVVHHVVDVERGFARLDG